jgi:hypothetical protein
VKSAPSRFFWLCGDCAEKLSSFNGGRRLAFSWYFASRVWLADAQHGPARTSSPEASAIPPTSPLQSGSQPVGWLRHKAESLHF